MKKKQRKNKAQHSPVPVVRFPVRKCKHFKVVCAFSSNSLFGVSKKHILFCHAYTCKRKCVRVMLRVLSASLLYGGCADNPRMIRQRSCHENAAITICDQQVCQHSHFIRPFHTGLHSNEYYSALSYALQIPANDMLFFFSFVALSPNARRSHVLCQLQMRLAVISRLKKFGTQHCTDLAYFAHSSKNVPFVMSQRVPIGTKGTCPWSFGKTRERLVCV